MLVVMTALLTIPINFNAHKAMELLYVVVCVCVMHGYVRANAGCVRACVHECVRCMCTLCMYFNIYDVNLCSNACVITIIAKCFRLKELW